MLFNVESDLGDRLHGYLVTDSFSGQGRIHITSGGRPIATAETTQQLPALVVAGRHETGRCGFIVDETIVPGLQAMSELEIRDAESGLLIYRRAPETSFVAEKLIRLETHLLRLRYVDQVMRRYFCYAYLNAERAGLESVTQIFHLLQVKSLYLSGRFFYRSFEALIEQQCKMVCIIHDPFEELAERLLLLRHSSRRARLDMRDTLTFAASTEFASTLPLADDRKLRSAFGHIPADAAQPLQNPLVRQMTATNPQEMPRGGSLAAALSVLGSCAIVGLRSESESFALALSGLIGSDREIVPVAPRCTAAMELADRLRRIPRVHDLLGLDLELYQRVAEAYRQAAAGLSIPGGTGYFPVP